MSDKMDVLKEVMQNLKDARQSALLGNYDGSLVFYEGVIHELHHLINTNLDDLNLKVSKQDVLRLRKLIEEECGQVKDITQSLQLFKSSGGMAGGPIGYPPSAMPFHGAGAMGSPMGAGPAHHYYGGLNDPYEMPERDPDVWPPPPPLMNKNNYQYRPNLVPGAGVGYQIPYNNNSPANPGAKYKDYKGKQVPVIFIIIIIKCCLYSIFSPDLPYDLYLIQNMFILD